MNCPAIATEVMLAPYAPVFGLTRLMTGVAALTVNPLTIEAFSPPVVAVTVTGPGVAVELILMETVA